MNSKLLFYPALLLMLGSECKHDASVPPLADPLSLLPAETQTGTGTFGCLVNGKAYTTASCIKCNGDWQGINTLAINGNTNANSDFHGELFTASMLINGTLRSGQNFNLATLQQSPNPTNNQFVANAVAGSKPCVYEGNYVKTGRVELTKFDGVARVAAGRFAFTLYEPGGCDTLRVTDGRFDVKF
ncbi:hypothetical protein [Hymenobacter coccineus]|uniref:hypothetical protein n=1 Tax=Hymenobacter coccineus TaxID=1908235 RepID=UPI000F7AD6DE|nr:hypothetical protein [Hymenobacter coccineus]